MGAHKLTATIITINRSNAAPEAVEGWEGVERRRGEGGLHNVAHLAVGTMGQSAVGTGQQKQLMRAHKLTAIIIIKRNNVVPGAVEGWERAERRSARGGLNDVTQLTAERSVRFAVSTMQCKWQM